MMYVRTMDLVLLYARSANCDGHQSNLIKSDRGGVHPLNGVTLLQYNTVDSTCMHSPIRSSVLQMDRQQQHKAPTPHFLAATPPAFVVARFPSPSKSGNWVSSPPSQGSAKLRFQNNFIRSQSQRQRIGDTHISQIHPRTRRHNNSHANEIRFIEDEL